jgi:hypothetical protein
VTLLVAGTDGTRVWMISDAAITGGDVPLRDREYEIKILPSLDGRALIGFVGDQHHGARMVRSVATSAAGQQAISALLAEHLQYPSVDLAYGYVDEHGAHLFRISQGEARQLPAFHIGNSEAFNHFQRIRHATEIDPAPKAVETFILGAPVPIPEPLHIATVAMLRLFAERSERDVGGWALPYLLTPDGAFLCSYAYSVSDPILAHVAPGSLVPHGTPEAGGFGLSVTELGHAEGLAVYWPQLPGGYLFVGNGSAFKKIKIAGSPSEFKEAALRILGKPVEIWFGDKPLGRPDSVTVVTGEDGKPAMAIARRDNNLSFSVLNVETVFHSKVNLNFNPDRKMHDGISIGNLKIQLAQDSRSATLDVMRDGRSISRVSFQANELEKLLAHLAEMRAAMPTQMSPEPPTGPETQELVIVDPAWRTNFSVHSDLDGILMRLRHLGFGWLTFLLPHHEAKSLGDWLSKNAKGNA